MQLKFVLIPAWVATALQSRHAPLSDVLSVEKLNSTLSVNDVAFYLYSTHKLVKKYIPILDDVHISVTDPINGDNDTLGICRKMADLAAVETPVSWKNLLDHDYVPHEDVETGHVFLFNLEEIEENVIAIRPFAIENGEMAKQHRKECLHRAVAFLHRYESFTSVAKSELFRNYCVATKELLDAA